MFPSIHLGFADIPTYSTIFLAGFFIAIVIARKIAGRYRLAKEDVLYGAIYAAIGILIGSKLLYCLTRLPSLIQISCMLQARCSPTSLSQPSRKRTPCLSGKSTAVRTCFLLMISSSFRARSQLRRNFSIPSTSFIPRASR